MTKPTLMDRTRAAVAYVNTKHGDAAAVEMAAFLELFHPEMPDDKKRELIRAAKSGAKP